MLTGEALDREEEVTTDVSISDWLTESSGTVSIGRLLLRTKLK